MAQIRIDNLRKEFGSFTAVQGSSFTIEDGEFFMLLGPSGCGKTTTLRMMAGLELPTSGEIYIDGEEVAQKRASQRDIAFVFQMFALYPHMNVRRQHRLPAAQPGHEPRRDPRPGRWRWRASSASSRILDRPVGRPLRRRPPARRARARHRARPKAFFMDEPLGALDAEFREHMAEELRALHDRMGATTVYVTHDQLEAMQMGDKIVVMNHGVVEQFGVPQDIYDWPATMFVADFIGSPPMNFLPFDGVVAARRRPRPPRRRRGRRPGPARRRLAARSSSASAPSTSASTTPPPTAAEVVATEYLGTTQIVTLRTARGDDQGPPRRRPRGAGRRDHRPRLRRPHPHGLRGGAGPGARAPPPTRGCSHG